MKTIIILLLALAASQPVYAAVGCDLNDPDRDVKRLFPGSTGYRTTYFSISGKGGKELLSKIEKRLGDRFHGLYETIEVPYTLYEIYKGTNRVGYIHGVNQKGRYGGIQVFLTIDPAGKILGLYFQKLTSKEARLLRDEKFGRQFYGMDLSDFYSYDVLGGKSSGKSRVAGIKNPAPEAGDDFRATLRAVKKNLILMDEFVFGNRYLKYFSGGGK